MYKKILIFLPSTFSKRDYERFGIKYLKKNFLVKILDFTAWLYPNYWKECYDKVYKCEEYKSIQSKQDFLEFINDEDSVIVLDDLEKNVKTNWIRKQLKKKKTLFVGLDLNLIPIPKKNFLTKLNYLILRPKVFFYVVIKYFFKYFKFDKVYQPQVSIVSGKESFLQSRARDKIYAHSMDYDIYLNLKKKSINKEPYVVFLDEDMANHPDYLLLNFKKPVEESKYFETLVKFFKKFESETKFKVKISVHPRSRTKHLEKYLKDFELYKGNTAELVKDSSMVLLHSSTSISYAILFEKSIIFLTSDELKKSWIGPRIFNLSKVINSKLINMSDLNYNFDVKNLFNFDQNKYQEYKDQYLKYPNSPDIPLWEIFTKNIIKNYNNKTT